ncbi:hypothetical protein IPJ70_00565 [Candidatus Campbellbacteria bacterium]|nr:MAG: hypothetical protein IPJ70_00565 [Candidatus Campbellbacteria bacterium]
MAFLRDEARRIRPNNKRIDEWVDELLEQCARDGKPVDVLTQWCLSKDLETRKIQQGGRLSPLPSEKKMILEAIPRIIDVFTSNGFRVNWWFTFNKAFVDEGRVSDALVVEYINLISALVSQNEAVRESGILINWEEEVLQGRQQPNREVMEDFFRYIPRGAFDIEMKNLLRRVQKYPNFSKSVAELEVEKKYNIACEVGEGKFLLGEQSPFSKGEFLLIPFEFPERYGFFEILAPGFQRRIAAVLKPYPWRIDADDLVYES